MPRWNTAAVHTQLGLIPTTGGHVWEAAGTLCAFMEAAEVIKKETRAVLELGAGTGWLGCTLAHNNPFVERIVLTEQGAGGALEHLENNVGLNKDLDVGNVECAVLEFGDTANPLVAQRWDAIIGSDLVYQPALAENLPVMWNALLASSPNAAVVYCHTFRRYDDLDHLLLKTCTSLNLRVFELETKADFEALQTRRFDGLNPAAADHDVPELFPEQKRVVLGICKA